MSLSKKMLEDKIEVVQLAAGYPVIQIREATIILENGVELNRTFHRRMLTPDADVRQETAAVKSIAAAVFTADAKAAYEANKPVAPV